VFPTTWGQEVLRAATRTRLAFGGGPGECAAEIWATRTADGTPGDSGHGRGRECLAASRGALSGMPTGMLTFCIDGVVQSDTPLQ
jgi:hypothetical protein